MLQKPFLEGLAKAGLQALFPRRQPPHQPPLGRGVLTQRTGSPWPLAPMSRSTGHARPCRSPSWACMQPVKIPEKFEKLEIIRNQKRRSTKTFLTLDDSSFYPPSHPFISRYLRTNATWPPQNHRQVKGRPSNCLCSLNVCFEPAPCQVRVLFDCKCLCCS